MRNGDICLVPKMRRYFYPDQGYEEHTPADKDDCFVVIVLGTAKKKEVDQFDPEEALIKLGWQPMRGKDLE